MTTIPAGEIRKVVEKRFVDALRILANQNEKTLIAYWGWIGMDEDQRRATTSHVAGHVLDTVNRHDAMEAEKRLRIRNRKDEDQSDSTVPSIPVVLTDAGAEALSALITATARDKDNLISEALRFLWAAMQSQLTPAE